MSEFLHHVVENREYIQRDMTILSGLQDTDPWEFSTPIPYTLARGWRLVDERDNNG